MLTTPHPALTGGSAIAVIQCVADRQEAIDELLGSLGRAQGSGGGALGNGRVALRSLFGVDTGLVARVSGTIAQLMPHGGEAIVGAILDALAERGWKIETPDAALRSDPLALYPEARDLAEGCALDALARATSPLAAEVLLHQAEVWRRDPGAPLVSDEEARALGRLLVPPVVVLIGAPNIGKSTLTNAMARRGVSIVADEPGTTRDHVGVTLDLAGLVVRWIDAPGLRERPSDELEAHAARLALGAAHRAELLVICHDGARRSELPASLIPRGPALRLDIELRSDRRGHHQAPAGQILTSGLTGAGLPEAALAVREALVPASARRGERRWVFHPALAGATRP